MRVLLCIFIAWMGVLVACKPETLKKKVPIARIVAQDTSLLYRNDTLWYNKQPLLGIVVDYYASKKNKSEIEYVDGCKNGSAKQWWENGNLQQLNVYENGLEQGVQQGWWRNGKLRFQYEAANGQKNGLAEEWYENGQPYTKKKFKQGVEHGLQEAWKRDSTLLYHYKSIKGMPQK